MPTIDKRVHILSLDTEFDNPNLGFNFIEGMNDRSFKLYITRSGEQVQLDTTYTVVGRLIQGDTYYEFSFITSDTDYSATYNIDSNFLEVIGESTMIIKITDSSDVTIYTEEISISIDSNSYLAPSDRTQFMSSYNNRLMPEQGVTGQILVKNSLDPFDLSWSSSNNILYTAAGSTNTLAEYLTALEARIATLESTGG